MTEQRWPLFLIIGAVVVVVVYLIIGRIFEIEPYEIRLAKPYIE